MKILITGGAGFVGSNLAIHLTKIGHTVSVLDNLVRRGSEISLKELVAEKISFAHGDIRNKEDINGNYDVILECSAQPSATAGYDNPQFDFTNNVVGCMNVLEHARKTGAAVIFWSTNKVYSGDKINAIPYHEENTRLVWDGCTGINEYFTIDGGQHSIYGMTKAMSDIACQEYRDAFGVNTIINRFSCLAGPRQWGKTEQGWVSWFVIAKKLGLPVKVCGWGGKQVRDVLFVDDICSLIEKEINVITSGSVKENVFTIGGGQKNSVSILECINMLGLTVSEITPIRKGDHAIYISDSRRAKDVLGWEPKVGIEEGFEKIEKWVSDNKESLYAMYK